MILEYLQQGYLTIMVILALIVTMLANRTAKINRKDESVICIAAVLTIVVSFFEFFEQWCDANDLSHHLLYLKAAVIYVTYPLIALLILYLTGVGHKLLMAVPQIIVTVLALVDLSEVTGIIYNYTEDHSYIGGTLNWIPFLTEIVYILLLVIQSMKALRGGNKAFGMIVIFMALSSLVTITLTKVDTISNQVLSTAVAMELFVFYSYLMGIQYRETREALYKERLEVERSKGKLLMSKIRPHFINSNLAVIRSLCYEDGEKAAEMIDHFSVYLRENIRQTDDMKLISFEKEMESVDNYLYLEMQRFQGRIQVEKRLELTDFDVPPLTIQTIVENAVRHGISMTGRKGTIQISTRQEEGDIVINIMDDGMGFDMSAANFDGTTHVGVKNVMDQFRSFLDGKVTLESAVGKGTNVTIRFPRREREE